MQICGIAQIMKNWILYERSENDSEFLIMTETGITDCVCEVNEICKILGENERISVKLSVSDEYEALFEEFYKYMKKEIEVLEDEEMKQELEILEQLGTFPNCPCSVPNCSCIVPDCP